MMPSSKAKKRRKKRRWGGQLHKKNVNEPYSDAMNLSQIDFVYHFEQMARTTKRLPVVSLVKYMEKPFVIPGRVYVSHPRSSLLSMEETKTV